MRYTIGPVCFPAYKFRIRSKQGISPADCLLHPHHLRNGGEFEGLV